MPSPDDIDNDEARQSEKATAAIDPKNADLVHMDQSLDKRATFDSTSDKHTVNNVMRHAYRVLSDEEKKLMQEIKDMGLAFHEKITALGTSRELSVAKTKTEEAVMWAVKHITR